MDKTSPPEGQTATLLTVVATLLVIAVSTRLITGRSEHAGPDTPPPMPGYWIPHLGHLPSMLLQDAGRFLARLSKSYPGGAVAVKLRGQEHVLIHDASLASALTAHKAYSTGDDTWFAERLIVSSFGLSGTEANRAAFRAARHQRQDGNGDALLSATTRQMVATIADFVTFNDLPADQTDWERLADADVPADSEAEAVDLPRLVGAFTSQAVTAALLGTNFGVNFPDFPEVLSSLDAGLSPWSGWLSSQRCGAARRRGQAYLREFHAALERHLLSEDEDPGIRWQDLDDVSGLVRERAAQIYTGAGVSLDARAAIDLGAAWDLTARIGPLVTWLLYEIFRDPVVLAQVRAEMAPYVHATQPDNAFTGRGVWIAPEVRVPDVRALVDGCPLLASAYDETVRVYGCAGTSVLLSEDVVLPRAEGASYRLRQGTYVDTAQEVMGQKVESPEEWQGARHVGAPEATGHNRHMHSMVDDGDASRRIAMVATALVLSLYEITPPEGKQWEQPGTRRRVAVRHPAGRMRVWIKRRELPGGQGK